MIAKRPPTKRRNLICLIGIHDWFSLGVPYMAAPFTLPYYECATCSMRKQRE